MIRSRLTVVTSMIVLAYAEAASGQMLVYSGSLTVPIVAQTTSYTSTIYVHNPNSVSINVSFTYQGATSSATPGTVPCASVEIAAGTVFKTSLAGLCPTLNIGSNFGALTTDYKGNTFAMYSRVETPSGNGFSVDGMVDTSGGNSRDVIGLRRQAAFPIYQSNCFIYNEASWDGRVVVTLAGGTGQLIASRIVNLQPYEFVRLLDVFAELSAPAGDYDNVRAEFESIVPVGGGQSVPFMASCTVQNSTSFDADFRTAKIHY